MDKSDELVYQLRFVDRHLRDDEQASARPLSEEEAYLWGFIKFAPHEMAEIELQSNPLFVGEHELTLKNPFAGAALHARTVKAAQGVEPLAAVEALLISIESGVYPPVPVPVLRWLENGLRTWHNSQGSEDLGKVLGLTRGKGATPPFKAALLEERDEMLMLDMDRLTYLGATQEEAAAMIEERLKSVDWNKTNWDMKDIGSDRLIALHKHHTPRKFDDPHTKNPLADARWVSDWLKNFNREYMPSKIKSRA